MNYLVYQSYGNKDNLNECCYSILSLLKLDLNPKKTQIVVYTDRKDYFSFLNTDIVFIELSKSDILDYRGSQDFVFRLKIKVLQDAVNRFEGNILYTDSDIYFLQPLDSLFDKISDSNFVMCNNEGSIGNGGNKVFNRFTKFIRSNKGYLAEKGIPIPEDVTMWNAGIIGFNTSKKDLLDKVLNTCDVILEQFYSHVIEQLAFSYQLQQHGSIEKSTDYVFHYWNLKEFRRVLAEFIEYHLQNSSFEAMIAAVDAIRPDVMIKPKMEYETLPFLKKALRKLRGKNRRWEFPEYSCNNIEIIKSCKYYNPSRLR